MSDLIPGISVVVCTRNRELQLHRLLDSFSRLTVRENVDWEVVVVDNNEKNSSTRVVDQFADALPLRLLHESSPGLSNARNHALEVIDPGRNTVWTDDDVTVGPGWLSVYERAFRYWPEFDFFGGPIVARFTSQPPKWIEAALEVAPEVFAHIDPTAEFFEMGEFADFLPFGANMAFRGGTFETLRFNTQLGRQPGLVFRGGDEIQVFRRLLSTSRAGLWLPPAKIEHWIEPGRQTLRELYMHELANALVEELLDDGCDLAACFERISEESLEEGFVRASHAIGEPDSSTLARFKSTAIADGRRLAGRVADTHFRHRGPSARRRTLVIGLDGFSPELAKRWMNAGELPNFEALSAECARFPLDHGDAMLTGLAWEHFSTGHSPDDYGRHSAVDFDVETYQVWQRGTRERTFVDDLPGHTVAFDVPYFDLLGTGGVSGLANWGAHDPGVARLSKPASLASEIAARFGDYPARPWIYGFVWPNVERAREMGLRLADAVDRRGEIARWLLTERFPDWDLGIVTVSEAHSAAEAFWHGVEPGHPLSALPSANICQEGMLGVYRAIDRMLGTLQSALPDVDLVLFSMHGMGANRSDVASMLLLPELLFRDRFGEPGFSPRSDWLDAALPMLAPHEDWSESVNACVELPADVLPAAPSPPFPTPRGATGRQVGNLDFMPATRYQPAWHQMDAFALPAFYDGRIRVNLAGRESRGRVQPSDYDATLDRLTEKIEACRDWRTHEPVVARVERRGLARPSELDLTDCDLRVRWRQPVLGIQHPDLGIIGPAPFRRPGGHSGPGMAWIRSAHSKPGHRAQRSSFDVAPTVFRLLGLPCPEHLSGTPLLERNT